MAKNHFMFILLCHVLKINIIVCYFTIIDFLGAHVFMDYYGKQGEIYKKHTIFGNSLIKLGAVVEKTFNRKVITYIHLIF